jgi:succinate dehydrogenase / fumarate reductase cytochrome b subunit
MSWVTKTLSSSLVKAHHGDNRLIVGSLPSRSLWYQCVHFLNDGGETFNEAAEFMAKNFFIRTAEIGLFVGLIAHIVDGLMLWSANKKKRPVQYAVVSKDNSTWYSRSMGLLGTLLLLFLVMHLKHFWVVSRFTDVITGGQKHFSKKCKRFLLAQYL